MAFPMSNTTTYNVEKVLLQNLTAGQYYNKTCVELNTWEDVVDEIYENVNHVEPWMSGNARGASTAFCLLHRLFTLNLQVRQVRDLLDHKDSPYIRAVGLLYLRYVCEPKSLWKWYEQYVEDHEMFSPSPDGPQVSIGDFARDLLLEQYYFETIFPRIPKPVMDQVVEGLKARKLPFTGKGNGGAGGADRRGVEDGNKRPASVKASLSVAMGQRAPNRASAREDRGRNGPASGRSPAPDDARIRSRSPAVAAAAAAAAAAGGAGGRGNRPAGDRDRRDYDDRRDAKGRSSSRERYNDRDRDRDDRDRRDDRGGDRRDDRGGDRRDDRRNDRGGDRRDDRRDDRGGDRRDDRDDRDRRDGRGSRYGDRERDYDRRDRDYDRKDRERDYDHREKDRDYRVYSAPERERNRGIRRSRSRSR